MLRMILSLTIGEFIAIRDDELKGWFFLARVTLAQHKTITVHYYYGS
jgi:hypothetical protein